MRLLSLFAIACTVGCATSDDAAPTDDAPLDGKADGSVSYVVNGHALTTRERQWMRYVADHVLPDLPGTPARKLEIASRAAWWSLKEGTFDTSNPPRYSNCNTSSGDKLIGPLATCGSGRAWQVGLAAVQVPNHTLAELEELADELYPDESIAEVLADAAAEAQITGDTADAIESSTGSLEKSWLLRRSAIGFVACERNEVVPECIDGSRSWCYGTGWDTTRWYAPTKSAALRSIHDIATLLAALSGGATAEPWIGTACTSDSACGYTGGFCFIPTGRTSGFCSLACEGFCPDRTGHPTTFCVAKATGGGMCTVVAGPLDHDCADLPGTQPFEMDRYVGASSAPAATATVCAY